jgi:preprotein translocase subunit SecE
MASTQIQTVSSGADRLKMGASVALLVLALAGYFLLAKQGVWVQWAAFLVGLAAAVGVFLTSELGQQLIAFGIDATRELKKVVWPTRKEATQMTLVVFGFVFVMALFLWLTDKSLEWIFYDLILGWKK